MNIIDQIVQIRNRIEQRPLVRHYVCVHALDEPFYEQIKDMVRMHIGEAHTMEGFLAEQWELEDGDGVDLIVGNSYRIAMLNNMIRMVESGEYKV